MQGMPGALQVLAALLHGVQTIHTYDSNKEPDIFGSLDLTATQVAQATTFFQQALLPHPMWLGPLPVCLVEHHHGKVRRLRLVLAALTHLTKAEITSLVEGPHLPGGTVLHDLVYGYAADASLEPEWLVITDGQQPRVRTPCGHGAQVIVEGREEQTDGGERNEDPKTSQNQTPKPAGRNSTIL